MRFRWYSYHDCEQAYVPMDIITSGDTVQVWIDLPGVRESDIQIYRYNDYLIIEGVKVSHYPEDEKKIFLRMERHSAPFRKLLNVSESENIENLRFELNDGVLHIVWQC